MKFIQILEYYYSMIFLFVIFISFCYTINSQSRTEPQPQKLEIGVATLFNVPIYGLKQLGARFPH